MDRGHAANLPGVVPTGTLVTLGVEELRLVRTILAGSLTQNRSSPSRLAFENTACSCP